MANKASKRTVTSSALRVLHVEEIQFDSTYQREAIDKSWKRIVANYNPQALGIPVVGEREDGSLWGVDGLQRITALKKLGKKEVRCEVFASKGPEHEAEVFKLINKNRTALKPLQIFKAMLTAGDTAAWEIKKLVEDCGFEIPAAKGGGNAKNPEWYCKNLGCINTVQRIYSKGGETVLRFVLKVVSEAWGDDPVKVRDIILAGLYLFWLRREGSVDVERLVPRLNTTSPSKVQFSAQQMAGDFSANVADVIERLYRKKNVGHA